MNVKIDIDISAEEMRKLLGLPDVEAFQREMMDDIRKRMSEGVEGYDPVKFFQPYVSGTLASWDLFQKMMSASGKGGKDADVGGTKK
jgi:hypothetical protein